MEGIQKDVYEELCEKITPTALPLPLLENSGGRGLDRGLPSSCTPACQTDNGWAAYAHLHIAAQVATASHTMRARRVFGE